MTVNTYNKAKPVCEYCDFLNTKQSTEIKNKNIKSELLILGDVIINYAIHFIPKSLGNTTDSTGYIYIVFFQFSFYKLILVQTSSTEHIQVHLYLSIFIV